jgi:hypothetical protein
MKNQVIEDRTIQRLVDNRLSESERTAVLLAAELEPELWRRVALAFVEEQVWSNAIPAAIQTAPRERAADISQRKGSVSRPSMFRSPWMLALAGLLLVGVTVGIRMLVDPPAADSRGGPPSVGSSPVKNDPCFLNLGGEQVPLYESTAPILEYMANGAGQEMIEKLWKNGLDVQPDTRYITGTASDGRAFVVPVRQYRLRPRFQ